jgi:hypothetical protein
LIIKHGQKIYRNIAFQILDGFEKRIYGTLSKISFHCNWDCWFDDFKCIPCFCFPTTINHSLFIWLRHQSKEGLVNSKCNKMCSITTKLERAKFEGQECFCCSSPHSFTMVSNLNHYIPKLLTFLPPLASLLSCRLSHI